MNTLARTNPYRDLESIQNRMLRAMGMTPQLSSTDESSIDSPDWVPAVDITEDDREYLIKAELPEVEKDDVKVTVDNGTLVLRGERQRESEETNRKVHRIERSYGSFLRSFNLPEDSDPQAVSADFKHGVLYVHLPKSEEKKPKQIAVNVS